MVQKTKAQKGSKDTKGMVSSDKSDHEGDSTYKGKQKVIAILLNVS